MAAPACDRIPLSGAPSTHREDEGRGAVRRADLNGQNDGPPPEMTTMASNRVRRLTVVRMPSDPLRLGEGEGVFVGVDVHKATYHVALCSAQRGLITTWVQPASPEVLIER